MNKTRKKLTLSKETVANLQEERLQGVAGDSGQITCGLTPGCSSNCPTLTCPTVGCPTFYCTMPIATC